MIVLFGACLILTLRNHRFDLGVGFRVKYGALLSKFADLPVWRTTSESEP